MTRTREIRGWFGERGGRATIDRRRGSSGDGLHAVPRRVGDPISGRGKFHIIRGQNAWDRFVA
jgi:hypothetical protein